MDRIHYFLNKLSFRINTYLENLSAEDLESFRYLHLNIENRIETKFFYIDFGTYRRLTTEPKKFTVLIKEDEKGIRISPVNRIRFFVSKLMHERSKTNMLSKLKFVRKVPSNTVTGKERFSLKYLYENELKHFTVTFIKEDFIMPKFRKRNGGAILDFFSLKIDDSSILKKNKRNSSTR